MGRSKEECYLKQVKAKRKQKKQGFLYRTSGLSHFTYSSYLTVLSARIQKEGQLFSRCLLLMKIRIYANLMTIEKLEYAEEKK